MKDICEKAKVPMVKAAVSWVLQQKCKPVVIVGCRTPEQVVDNYNVMKISDVSLFTVCLGCKCLS